MLVMLPAESPSPLKRRHALRLVEETLAATPITVVQGARRVGKSTLVRQVLGKRDVRVLSLDSAPVYNAAKADPARSCGKVMGCSSSTRCRVSLN